jgi:hypothetical protein
LRERKPLFDLEFTQIDPLRDTTSEILRAFPKDEEFNGLNRRQKGFSYEVYIQKLLEANNVEVCGNPSLYREWQDHQIEGYDIAIRLPNGELLRVECKLVLKGIFPSWFERDWLDREADVYVTNNVYAVPYSCRRRLEANGKKLLSTTEFITYIQKLMRGNNQEVESRYNTSTHSCTNTPKEVKFLQKVRVWVDPLHSFVARCLETMFHLYTKGRERNNGK